jgi:hypothetical protein
VPNLTGVKPPIAIKRRLPGIGKTPDYSRALYPDPPSHDFCTWLIIAEMMRRYYGAPRPLRVRFMLENGMLGTWDYGPFSLREQKAHPCTISREQSDIMLANVLRPAIEMIGGIAEPDVHTETVKLGELLPYVEYNYHIGHLVDAARQGYEVPQWQVPGRARNEVRDYLQDQHPVVITLREDQRQPGRNSRLSEWLKFTKWLLSTTRHSVLFVRDTCNADRPIFGFLTCPRASKDVHFRAALYQQAFVNLMVCNGPMTWCTHSPAPYLIFKQIVHLPEDPHWPGGTVEGWRKFVHLEVGEQFPWASPMQRLTWADDSFDEIRDAFTQLSRLHSA